MQAPYDYDQTDVSELQKWCQVLNEPTTPSMLCSCSTALWTYPCLLTLWFSSTKDIAEPTHVFTTFRKKKKVWNTSKPFQIKCPQHLVISASSLCWLADMGLHIFLATYFKQNSYSQLRECSRNYKKVDIPANNHHYSSVLAQLQTWFIELVPTSRSIR